MIMITSNGNRTEWSRIPSEIKAGVHMNLSEILVSLKRGWKGKKGLWNTTWSVSTNFFHFKLYFKTTTNLQNFLFPSILLILWEKLFLSKYT